MDAVPHVRPGWGQVTLVAVVVCAASWAVPAALADLILLVWAGSPWQAVLFATAAGATMASLLALPFGVVAGTTWWMASLVWRRTWGRWVFSLGAGAFFCGLCWRTANVLEQVHPWPFLAAVVLTTAALTGAAVASFSPAWTRWHGAGVAMAGVAWLVDLIPFSQVPMATEDLLALLTSGSLASVGFLVVRLRRWSIPPTAAVLVALLGAGSFSIWDGALTGDGQWRLDAEQYATWEPRYARVFRNLVDMDGDGFSPLAWGGDCDDLDAHRHPAAAEERGGGDRNCNGMEIPIKPTPAQRGLTEAAGNPTLPPDSVDLVLVIGVDAMRVDAFNYAHVLPNMHALAARGLLFTNCYSAGTRTQVSLTLMQRSQASTEPLGLRLARSGITSTFMMSIHWSALHVLREGFTTALDPPSGRWDAATVTRMAAEDVRANAGHKHLLWLHYTDAHAPLPPLPEPFSIITPPDEPDEYQTYVYWLSVVDREIGHLLDQVYAVHPKSRVAVLLTADHGEAFGEHGMHTHGSGIWQELVHVPAILVGPGLRPGVFHGLVSHRDVAKTVLGSFALEEEMDDPEWAGRSWWRLRDEREQELHRFVVTYSTRLPTPTLALSPQVILVEDQYKFALSLKDGLQQLFDLRTDRHELHNLVLQEPTRVRAMRAELELFVDLDGTPQWARRERQR